MAFDVNPSLGALGGPADAWGANTVDMSGFGPNVTVNDGEEVRVRKLELFEGLDEFGRLQPILGTAEPATDHRGNPIFWPTTQPYLTLR